MTTEQMFAKCRTLIEKKIGRRKTYDDEFNMYKLESYITVNLSKVSTNAQFMKSKSKIKIIFK